MIYLRRLGHRIGGGRPAARPSVRSDYHVGTCAPAHVQVELSDTHAAPELAARSGKIGTDVVNVVVQEAKFSAAL